MIKGQELMNALYLLSTHTKAEAIERAGEDKTHKAVEMLTRAMELDTMREGIDRNKQYKITEIVQEQQS